MYAVQNITTGYFYSESLILQKEAKHAGLCWDNASLLPCFARPYARYQDALRRSRQLSDRTGCICAVLWVGFNGVRK